MDKQNNQRPIGVFDSGMGGLTVLRALLDRLPSERFVYLGDTARLPYGTKSGSTVERYAMQAASELLRRDIKCLVVACNTASAVAVEKLQEQLAPMPVIGVVEPGAQAGAEASRSGRIAVIATEGTVRGRAYERAISRLRPSARITAIPCPLFVALAEEGWVSGEIVESVAHRYLDGAFAASIEDSPDTLVLGCTHFPVLAQAIKKVVGVNVAVVDSAQTTAAALAKILHENKLAAEGVVPEPRVMLLATDSCERFARVGGVFLGRDIDAKRIELVDLGS